MEGSTLFNELFQADWETWLQFLQDRWFVIAIVLVVLWIVIRVVKTVIKWAIVAVIVIGLLLYSGYSLQDLSLSNLKEIGSQIADTAKKEAVSAMIGEAGDATFTDHGDGTYTIKTESLEMKGKTNDTEVSVTFRGIQLGSWKIDDTIRSLIDQAQRNV